MLRRGSITVEMAKAGPQFCSEFSRAYLDPLQAADIGRVPVLGRRIDECSYHIQSARERAWAALEAVGDLASPGGCCIWSVVGGERELKEWALQQGWNGRRISEKSASRILISALDSLAGSYAPDPDMRSRAAKLAEIDRLSQHSRSERCLSAVVAAVTGALSPKQEGARISALKVESLTHAENVARPNG